MKLEKFKEKDNSTRKRNHKERRRTTWKEWKTQQYWNNL